MKLLLKELNTPFLPYDPKCDPTRQPLPVSEIWQEEFTKREWTIGARAVSTTRKRLCNPEAKPELKTKKAKESNPRKPVPNRTKSQDNSELEASAGLGDTTESIKLEPTENSYDFLDGTKHKDELIALPPAETNLKQEPILPFGAIESLDSS